MGKAGGCLGASGSHQPLLRPEPRSPPVPKMGLDSILQVTRRDDTFIHPFTRSGNTFAGFLAARPCAGSSPDPSLFSKEFVEILNKIFTNKKINASEKAIVYKCYLIFKNLKIISLKISVL